MEYNNSLHYHINHDTSLHPQSQGSRSQGFWVNTAMMGAPPSVHYLPPPPPSPMPSPVLRSLPVTSSLPVLQPPPSEGNYQIFIGNLSFFCQEQDLLNLFSPIVHVQDCRVMRSDDGTRSLLFGFITVGTMREVEEVCKLFDHNVYFGRRLRVQLTSQRTPTDINRASEVGLQVHCAITSSFAMNEIVLPTEQVLFKYFLRFGTISDVQVNNYSVREKFPPAQEGYAFVTFENHQAVERVVSNPLHVILGITVICAKSNRKPARHGNLAHRHLMAVAAQSLQSSPPAVSMSMPSYSQPTQGTVSPRGPTPIYSPRITNSSVPSPYQRPIVDQGFEPPHVPIYPNQHGYQSSYQLMARTDQRPPYYDVAAPTAPSPPINASPSVVAQPPPSFNPQLLPGKSSQLQYRQPLDMLHIHPWTSHDHEYYPDEGNHSELEPPGAETHLDTNNYHEAMIDTDMNRSHSGENIDNEYDISLFQQQQQHDDVQQLTRTTYSLTLSQGNSYQMNSLPSSNSSHSTPKHHLSATMTTLPTTTSMSSSSSVEQHMNW